jgi:hypothetical protein
VFYRRVTPRSSITLTRKPLPQLEPIKATITLADFARVAEGKLDIIGGGWDFTTAQGPSAVAIRFIVPWDRTNHRHHFCLELVDSDGAAVMAPTQDGGFAPVKVEGEFEVGRPPGIPEGTRLSSAFAFPMGPLPFLVVGKRYVWHLTVNHEANEDWDAPFTVVPPPPPPMRIAS